MKLPQIDAAILPQLDTLTRVFGSLAHKASGLVSGDETVIIITFLYELLGD